ncbi:MAG: class I SAM-dependent methyltransferase [Verrucomicrobiaceae bacterium]
MNLGYRLLAPLYAWSERLIFGNALQHCRTAFIRELPQTVLTVGDGDGRFTQALLKERPDIRLQVIEPDEAMRRQSLNRNPGLTFVSADTAAPCDAIILNFVLDLFTEPEAHRFLDQLPKADTLIVGDFFPHETHGKAECLIARLLTWVMYRFFALTTGLRTKTLPPTRSILQSRGWTCQSETTQWSGFIRSQQWSRIKPPVPRTT